MGVSDGLLAVVDEEEGSVLRVLRYQGPGADRVNHIARGENDSFLAGGEFSVTLDADRGDVASLRSSGAQDIWLSSVARTQLSTTVAVK